MAEASPKKRLEGFIRKYSAEVAAEGRAALASMRRLVPGATELIYDNWQWLVVGFGPSERASEAVCSVVFTPRWITLCFLQNGPLLKDPKKLLRGSGRRVRSIRLASAKDLTTPAIRALIGEALYRAAVPIDPDGPVRQVVRAVAVRQKSRRPR